MKKKRGRDKEIKAEGMVRAKERKGEEGERERRRETEEDIQINTCVCQVIFFCYLVFSPAPVLFFLCISLAKHALVFWP